MSEDQILTSLAGALDCVQAMPSSGRSDRNSFKTILSTALHSPERSACVRRRNHAGRRSSLLLGVWRGAESHAQGIEIVVGDIL